MPRGRIIAFPTIVPKRDDDEDDDVGLTVPCGTGFATFRPYVEAGEPGAFSMIHFKGVSSDPCDPQCVSFYRPTAEDSGVTMCDRFFPDPFPGGNTGYPE